MTNSKHHIEEMQARFAEIAKREQRLIQTLSDALSEADRRLLDDVRSVTIEHEARRAVILSELQVLASRIGTFPASEEPLPMIEASALDVPTYAEESETVSETDHQSSNGGDWRQAAQKIRDEFDFFTAQKIAS